MDKQRLRELVQKNTSDLAAAIKAEDWEIHMQLSPLRQSLLNWYEFRQDASLLELHGGYGALTGLFCARCARVTSIAATAEEEEILLTRYEKIENLQIIRGSLPEIVQAMDEQYDYIVAFGSIEYAENPAAAINQWMQQLKPGGTLLLTADNRYGLKYFCGAKDPHTSCPFDGVNGYLGILDGDGWCMSRKELLTAIEQAGIAQYQFYYPVPDSRMPQMIFSDGYMKGLNTAERLVDYNYEDKSMLGVEHRIFCEMIDSGALPFMANSFLVELTKEGKLSDIVYAVTTTDRGRIRGTATTIRSSGKVKKRALWPEGEENIQNLHEHTKELARRGVPIVPTELERDSCGLVLSMPYINKEGLSTVMKRLAVEDRERFIQIFDEIYGYLLAASDTLEDEVGMREDTEKIRENTEEIWKDTEGIWEDKEEIDGEPVKMEGDMEDKAGQRTEDSKDKAEQRAKDTEDRAGQREGNTEDRARQKMGNAKYRVLKKAYLDLAPCNCFYDKENGTLLFYDQEFVLENCPAQFAMFRSLKYCYESAREMDREIPLKEMYKRYGIEKQMVEAFERKEAEFLQSVRNIEQYRRIFQWATPDYVRISKRISKMADLCGAKEEPKPYRVGYVPGVFDLFHTGHLNLLERCKSRCTYLIVGVLTDELVEFYKGSKTVLSYEERARIIEALKIVDEVIPVDFSNTDKLDAWEQLHYDCHFSGDDHLHHWKDVWEELRKRGSNMEFFPYTQGISSTQLREKLGIVR